MLKPRLLCIGFMLLSFLSSTYCATPSVELINVLIQPDNKKTRLVFEFTQKIIGKISFQNNPARLIVEFNHAKKSFILEHLSIKDPIITAIKDDPTNDDSLRIIFYVKQGVRWKSKYFKNKRLNTNNFQIDIVTIPQHKPSIFEQAILSAFLNLTTAANENIIQQDKLAQQRLKGKLPEEKTKIALAKKQPTITILIDPGHGGKDSGAIGGYGIQEKMVVLNIAKYLAKKINSMYGMRAILTREGDYLLPLRTRLSLARQNKADLFIAIHADAYFQRNASGASVYSLSKRGATSEASRWLAQKDNYSELGGVELDALKDRSPVLRSVLIDLAQTTTIRESMNLGNQVLTALDEVTNLKNKRVEQAPFVVLKSPDIPSILIETGFITNPNEEKRLASAFYQEQLAQAMATGIKNYISKYLLPAS